MSTTCRTVNNKNELSKPGVNNAWYRQPIAWLGIFVFALSMAGCVWMIVVAMQNPDVPTYKPDRAVLGVPTTRPASSATTSP